MAGLFGILTRFAACKPHQSPPARSPLQTLSQLLLVLGVSFLMLSPREANAMSDKEAVDVTIDILVTAGQTLGVPLDKDVVKIIKDVVGCSVSKGSGTDCVKNVVVARALEQMGLSSPTATEAVSCLVVGNNAVDCLKKTAIEALPAEARPLANCIAAGGDVADCTAKAAVAQILPKVTQGVPPEVVNAVNCVIGGTSLEQCGKNLVNSCTGSAADVQRCVANGLASQAKNPQAAEMIKCLGKSGGEAQACASAVGQQVLGPNERKQIDEINRTFAELAKIKAGTNEQSDPRAYPQQPLALYNMIKITQGVRDNEIGTIILYGGSALYQVAAGIIINYFLPGMGPILGPVAASMILNHTVAIQQGFNAVVKGDPVGLAEAAAEWYANTYIAPVCGLIPEGEFKNITCGTVAKAISTIVGAAGDVAKAILGVGEDFLKLIGVWDFVDNVASGIWNGIKDAVGAITGAIGDGFDAVFGGSDDKKPTLPPSTPPAEYFANMAGACLGKATARVIASRAGKPGDPDTSKVLEDCTNYYTPYVLFQPIAKAQCQRLVDGLNAMAQAASDNLLQAAKSLTDSGAPAIFLAKVYAQNRTGDDGGDHGAGDLCSPDFWTNMNTSYARFCANQLHTPMKDGTKRYPDSFKAGNVSEQAKMCPMPTYSGATEGACLSALQNFKKEQADREAKDPKLGKMVGPDSALCKMQKKNDDFNAAMRPNCDSVGVKKVDAGGKVIDLPRGFECDSLQTHFPRPGPKNPAPPIDTTVQKIPNQSGLGVEITVIDYKPGKESSPVPGPLDPPRLQSPKWPVVVATLPGPGSGGAYYVDGSSGNTPVTDPKKSGAKDGGSTVHLDPGTGLKPPNGRKPGGGSGGINLSRQPPAEDKPRVTRAPPQQTPVNNGPGSGGFNTSRPGNSAMDTLGNLNTSGGLNNAAGVGSGGAALGRPPPLRPPPSPVATGPSKGGSGGSGGVSMVNSPTKGGTGGWNGTNSQSGNSPASSGQRYTPTTKLGAKPSTPKFDDSNINYGGCSGCGSKKDPLVVR